MNRKPLTCVLLILVLAAVVAPTAAPAPRAYTAGHFALEVGGQYVYDGPGELLSESSLVLRGTRTQALESWAKAADLRTATVVQAYDGGRVVTYAIVNAWPKYTDDGVTITFGPAAP
jgi:hypothetical protein